MPSDEPKIQSERILPRRVRPQPVPFIYKGGDCGACVVGGLLGMEVPDVYTGFAEKGEPTSWWWSEMSQVLYNAKAHMLLDRLITDVPIWHQGASRATWGNPSWSQNISWFQYVAMALDAGYYGMAGVDHARRGPMYPGDHWVMIVGHRTREVLAKKGVPGTRSWILEKEILVSNSSTSAPAVAEEWVDHFEFLARWGGYNLLLARPIIEHPSP